MKLKRFNQKTTATAPRGSATIRFAKAGSITISGIAAQQIGFTESDFIEIVQDEENIEDWYIVKSDKDSGFKLRKGTTGGTLAANNVVTTNAFRKQFPKVLKTSVGCLVGSEPVVFDDVTMWPIITASAH